MNKNKWNYLAGWISVITNMVLFSLKLLVGMMTGSLALVTDAWHTLSDSFSSIIVIISAKISKKPSDKDHPFGHERVEYIGSIIIGVLLIIIGINFFKDGISSILHPEKLIFGPFAITVTVISILFKEGLAQFSFWAGKKAKSSLLKADGWHHRSDAISSIIVLIGIFTNKYFPVMDGIIGLIIALMIIYTGIMIIKEASSPLLGTPVSPELQDEVKKIISGQFPSINHPHHFHLHQYGSHKELTFHIEIFENLTIKEIHQITERLRDELLKCLLIESTIYIDCPKKI